MKVLLWLALLAGSVAAQYEVKDFGGPWLPGQHAVFLPPGTFSHSENFFVQPGAGGLPGYRVQRRGLTKAVTSVFTASGPVLALKEFWHEGDSLAVLLAQGGSWYYSNYAKIKYSKTNWYDGNAGDNRTYDADYTLNAPREIRPYSAGTVDLVEGYDSLEADSENRSLFFRFAQAGDSVSIDTDQSGTWDHIFRVKRVVTNRALIIDTGTTNIVTRPNCWYRLKRTFSTTAIPDVEIYDQRAYITNGVDPMQVVFWWDSTNPGDSKSGLFMREVHTAQRVPINDVQGWFYDTLNHWISPEDAGDFGGGSAKVDSFNLRFTRLYSYGKAWAFGEWSGGLEVGPTELYFFRFGNNSGSVSSRQARTFIAPILYNDENSLVLLNPLLGERDTLFRANPIYLNYYPFHDENDSTSYHVMLTSNMVGREGYILSMAGNLEVVIPRGVSGTIKALGNASLWVSEDQNVRDSIAAGTVGFNQHVYFIHSLNPEQNQNKTIVEQETFSYKYFNQDNLPQPLPTGWSIVFWYTYRSRSEDYIKVRIPNIDTTEIAVSAREFYPVRHAIGSSGGDSVIFITSNQPAGNGLRAWMGADSINGIDTVTITDWELLRAEVPRFAGIEAQNRIGLVGWGDSSDAGLLSRTTETIRGTEPENWSPAHDVKFTDAYDPVVAVESNNDFQTVFTTNQTFGAQLTSAGYWSYEELAKDIGCIAPRSIVMVNDILYFRARDGFYRMRRRDLSGMTVELISSQISAVLSRMDLSAQMGHKGERLTENHARRGLEVGVWDDRTRRIWWFVAMGASNYPNYALTYSPETGAWDGVHSLGAAAATSLVLRDTTHLLLADPTRGMIAWANVGPTDSGVQIMTALEGMIFGPAGDTVRVRPEQMTLTYTIDATQVGGPDSLLWIMENLKAPDYPQSVLDTGVLVLSTSGYGDAGLYTAVDRLQIDGVGQAAFWRWRLQHRANTVNTLWHFQPLRMSVTFLPGGMGD